MAITTILPVILSGGSGTRLWPLSRKSYPKQLIPLLNKHSLLQNTVQRLSCIDEFAVKPLMICNHEHRFLVAEQLREINTKPNDIILEPVGRNTTAAIATAALYAKDKDIKMILVLPADHHIENSQAFCDAVKDAIKFAEDGHLMTFGITPDKPNTGYGYLQKGADLDKNIFEVKKFIEKPDLELAKKYCDSGNYFWNSGMFLFSVDKILDELKNFAPISLAAAELSFSKKTKDLDFIRLDEVSFAKAKDEAIDKAVMEKADKVAMRSLDAGWNDIGAWDAVFDIALKNKENNKDNSLENISDKLGNIQVGDVLLQDVKDSYVRSESRLIAALGVKDQIIVETRDAVFVADKSKAQLVKNLVNQLKAENRTEPLKHRILYRPWGSHELLIDAPGFQVRWVRVKPGCEMNLQRHMKRSEHWVVVSGVANAVCGDKKMVLEKSESVFIPKGELHQLGNASDAGNGDNIDEKNNSDSWLEVIEVQVGESLGEHDIERV
jgi:mannose-1-phosphate guanylyltransferase/mannose-6-phosphate isomerase